MYQGKFIRKTYWGDSKKRMLIQQVCYVCIGIASLLFVGAFATVVIGGMCMMIGG